MGEGLRKGEVGREDRGKRREGGEEGKRERWGGSITGVVSACVRSHAHKGRRGIGRPACMGVGRSEGLGVV